MRLCVKSPSRDAASQNQYRSDNVPLAIGAPCRLLHKEARRALEYVHMDSVDGDPHCDTDAVSSQRLYAAHRAREGARAAHAVVDLRAERRLAVAEADVHQAGSAELGREGEPGGNGQVV